MNYREVLEEQIKKLQILQDEIMNNGHIFVTQKIEGAIKVADEIEKLVSLIARYPALFAGTIALKEQKSV